MSSDFNFNEPRANGTRIDYKKTFLNPQEGTNNLRITDLAGKSFKVHYVKDINGKNVFVKSPGPGDPLVVEGNKPRTRYYLKVIDRESGLLKVWEFGAQIRQAIEEFISDLKDERAKSGDESNLLTNYDLILRKRRPGSNPLYTLQIAQKLSADTLASDQVLIDNDEIDFAPLLKPWTIDRIKEQILGVGADGTGGGDASFNVDEIERQASVEPAQTAPQSESAPRETVPSASATPAETVKAAESASESWLDD
ncbi:MAG TPA: hypothetical protein VMW10_06500 [Alphaproteobacteria bacterium]|nr:hypothetical protein [Alphaproteobacteria bacterium]